MRKLYFTAVFLFSLLFSFAAPIVTVVERDGTSNRDLPRDANTVLIPRGKAVETNRNFTPKHSFFKVTSTSKITDHHTAGQWVSLSKIIDHSIVSLSSGQVIWLAGR